ncbi:MAG: SirB1 family protein [Pseudanabaenaceae cyanobacterium]
MLSLSPARQMFWQIAQIPDQELGSSHLLEGALAIAWEAEPTIDIAAYRQKIIALGDTVAPRLAAVPYALKKIQLLNQFLFTECGFRGNEADYYNPANSFLTYVLDQRLGIPITLSVLYMIIAERLGLPMEGVSFPGHFLVRPHDSDLEFFIDAYHGEIIFVEDCTEKLRQLYGGHVPFDPSYLAVVGVRKILERMLTNLKLIYLRAEQFESALAVVERLLMLNPNLALQRRDHGLLCYQLERYSEARMDLENYLELMPQASDLPIISQLLTEISRHRI